MPNAPWGPINREGRNEFQLSVAAVALVTGTMQVGFGQRPAAIAELMQPVFQYIWCVFLIAGGVLVLSSALWKRVEGAIPYMEITGLMFVGGPFFTYGAGLLRTVERPLASVAGPLCILLGLACISRTVRIIHALLPKKIDREQALREEVRKQMVNDATRAADEIVDSGRVTDTGAIPLVKPPEDDPRRGQTS